MSLKSALLTTQINWEKRKKGLEESFDLSQYLTSQKYSVTQHPFPHFVIDNFFNDKTYLELLNNFNEVLKRGTTQDYSPTQFHPFLNLKGRYAYDGFVHGLQASDTPVLAPFFSVAWNLLFSDLFKQATGFCTSAAYHFHLPGDKTGFVHNDFAPKNFSLSDRLSNGIIYRDRGNDQRLPVFQEKRIISLLYYLGNDEWNEGDGGETGFYAEANGEVVKKVAPKNNRMLAFLISPKSFHAFQETHKPRSSIVQWFHVNNEWVNARYGMQSANTVGTVQQ